MYRSILTFMCMCMSPSLSLPSQPLFLSLSLSLSLSISINTYINVCIYRYMERERERALDDYVIHDYIHNYFVIYVSLSFCMYKKYVSLSIYICHICCVPYDVWTYIFLT